jgi:uncharacterized protein (DUF1919 family)
MYDEEGVGALYRTGLVEEILITMIVDQEMGTEVQQYLHFEFNTYFKNILLK